MADVVASPPGADANTADATEALVERLFEATIGSLEVASVHVGCKLGYYRALADSGDSTPGQLAARTGTTERYAREWLEQQAVAGILTVDDADAEAPDRRYALPAAHRPVLVDEEAPHFLAPISTLVVGVCGPMEALLGAYRGGDGVPYEAYGADLRDGIAALNRPMFVNELAGWLSAIPEVDARLRATPPARVADLACGSAWSSTAIARAYAGVTVDAIDVDAASIEAARANVATAGLADRVHPVVHDAGDVDLDGRYDLITIFEALHDMNHPVAALRAARAGLAAGGYVVIGDERVAERFTAPGDALERFNYGWSILHCLTVGLLDRDSAGTGTVIRPDTVRAYASDAGFGRIDVLPIEHEFWRFYRLTP